MLLNVGEAYIVVNILSEAIDEDEDLGQLSSCTDARLKLKIFGGPATGEI